MKIGDLVKRKNNGDLAIVIPIEYVKEGKVNVLTMRGHKQHWYSFECEVIK